MNKLIMEKEIENRIWNILSYTPSDEEKDVIRKIIERKKTKKTNNQLKKIYYRLDVKIEKLILERSNVRFKGKVSKVLHELFYKDNWMDGVIIKVIQYGKLKRLLR